jgi:ligand-binding sensor domain-containing protein
MSFKINTSVKYLVLIFALLGFEAHAQLVEQPNFEFITEKDGLPFNQLTCLAQDKQGFIWVGSFEGLARYDGYNFVTVDSVGNLPNTKFVSLAVDANGEIWCGHQGGVVSRYNPATREFWYTEIKEATNSVVRKIFIDSDGTVWAFIELSGIYRFNGKTFDFVTALTDLPAKGLAPQHTYNRIVGVTEDDKRNLWLGTHNGLYRFNIDDSSLHHEAVLSTDKNLPASIMRVVYDGKGGIWCATYGTGLIYYNTITKQHKQYLFERGPKGTFNIVFDIGLKNANEIWVSVFGLGVFNIATEQFNFYNDIKDFDSTPISSLILVDKHGIAWTITNKGLLKYDEAANNFRFFKLRVSKSDNHSNYIVADVVVDPKTKRKIIGTQFAEGLYIINPDGSQQKIQFPHHPKGEPYQLVPDVLQTSKGRIYILTYSYLYELMENNTVKPVTGITNTIPPEVQARFSEMIETKNGDLWVGSYGQGLFRLNANTQQWERFTTDTQNTVLHNRVNALVEDGNQRVWALHYGSGISVYTPLTKSWTYFKNDSTSSSTDLLSNLVVDAAVSQSGNVWVATQEGIAEYSIRENAFSNLTKEDGLISEVTQSICIDAYGTVWASTLKGLMSVDSERVIRQYNFKDGLKGQYSSYALRRGEGNQLYICTNQGYYAFDPLYVARVMSRNAPMVITSIRNLDQLVHKFESIDRIDVEYEQNSIVVEYALLNFLSAYKNLYQYKMDGLDKGWIKTYRNAVTYSGMPSGTYTFRVQLAGAPETERTLTVVVSTPLWRQVWFRFILLVLGLAGIYWAYRLRLSQVRQEEKLKSEFGKKLAEVEMKALKAQMNPHFIFNSLNSINRYIIKSDPEKASLYLTKFSKLIRLILDNSNNKLISLEQELTALKLYIELEVLRFNEKFTYSISVNEDVNPLAVGVPPMIIQPFVENAIWHGLLHKESAGKLEVRIERYGDSLKCIIADNGVGRAKAAEAKSKAVDKEKSFGMKITGDRLAMLNGEATVESIEVIDLMDSENQPAGTQVIVKIMTAEMEPDF